MDTVDSTPSPMRKLLCASTGIGLLSITLGSVGVANGSTEALATQPTSAIAAPSAKVTGDAEVKIFTVKIRKGGLRIKGKVIGVKDKRANVYLEHRISKKKARKSRKRWRVVVRSSTNTQGRFTLRFDHRKGKFQVRALLPVSPASLNPTNKPTPPAPVVRPKSAPKPNPAKGMDWVVALGDSYISGEGAAYAGYNPQTNSKGAFKGTWWAQVFGFKLKDTFPGDYAQPIAQAALTDQQLQSYSAPLYGWLCHRSESASMYWGDPSVAALNLACSGATAATNIATGKPGIDFATGTSSSSNGSVAVKGQAAQLQEFATKARAQGDRIKQILMSIGGNDINFASIVTECVTDYIKKLLPFVKSCWENKDSTIKQEYDSGLIAIRSAVISSGDNIVRAMRAAGYADDSYTIQLAAYPIGVPASADVKTAFSNWPKRQDYCGMGLSDDDLDAITGEFKELMRQRSIEGAATLANQYPEVGIKVLDASDALSGHEMCSNAISYPQITNPGVNTIHPAWYGVMGGKTGAWISPVWACAQVNLLCGLDTLYELMPKLMTAMDCDPISTTGKNSKCTNSLAQANVQGLPFHPSYFGQRALAQCQQAVTQEADRRVIRCVPPPSPGALDPVGRPNMIVSDIGPLKLS